MTTGPHLLGRQLSAPPALALADAGLLRRCGLIPVHHIERQLAPHNAARRQARVHVNLLRLCPPWELAHRGSWPSAGRAEHVVLAQR